MAKKIMIDGNTAAATVAYSVSEICAIYPITPSSNMGEIADEMSAAGKKNIWGTVPEVVELQSEGGASGTVHGALTSGALSTTFTASQGLMLMLPNMYKIAGELTSTVFHVSARALACQALSIFGDHSDVMAARSTGFAMLASNSIQEVMDLALISHAATLEARVPFLHFFDGFRTSHEIQKIEEVTEETMRQMIDDELVLAHRRRGLTPDKPVIRGTSQNPDVYFQGRETVNKFYQAVPAIVQKQMDKFASLTGRQYKLFEYAGAPDAEKVIVVMGSAAETVHETVNDLVAKGKKVGVLKVRLFRPFDVRAFIAVLPPTVKTVAALDRTKEAGAIGEPLYLDVRAARRSRSGKLTKRYPRIQGGHTDWVPKFTLMVKAVFDNMTLKAGTTSVINDDVTHTSLKLIPISIATSGRIEVFMVWVRWQVGANKNSIKINKRNGQLRLGHFEYDSKKAGAITIFHLRLGRSRSKALFCTRRILLPVIISSWKNMTCFRRQGRRRVSAGKSIQRRGSLELHTG